MEIDGGKVRTGHLENVVGVGEEDVAAHGVGGHELVFALFEGFEGLGVVAFNPAGFVERDGFPAALGAVFMEKSVLDNLKLKLPDSADNLASVELVDKQLCDSLVH